MNIWSCRPWVVASLLFGLIDSLNAQDAQFKKDHEPPARLRCFEAGYRSVKPELRQDSYGGWSLVLESGAKFPWDDKHEKSQLDWLKRPDLEDTVKYLYPSNDLMRAPPQYHDPGRARVEDFLKEVYGASPTAVRQNLTRVVWLPKLLGRQILFNRRNGAADALQRVSNKLDSLPKSFQAYIEKTAGTFNWRFISKTKRLSTHSFGIAIDINIEMTDYWQWTKPIDGRYVYRNRIPMEIVKIFESEGFIWGGRWYHFDTMHFEYRPEFLHPNCRQEQPVK